MKEFDVYKRCWVTYKFTVHANTKEEAVTEAQKTYNDTSNATLAGKIHEVIEENFWVNERKAS